MLGVGHCSLDPSGKHSILPELERGANLSQDAQNGETPTSLSDTFGGWGLLEGNVSVESEAIVFVLFYIRCFFIDLKFESHFKDSPFLLGSYSLT